MEKVVILGSGIAGLTAAVYTARADLAPLVIGGPEEGGQLTLTTRVENFPGFPQGIDGPQLIMDTKEQAQKFGAKFITGAVKKLEEKKGKIIMTLDQGNKIETETAIIATGASARWLGIPSEEKYKGRGISTCATCDGALYKNKEVLVIGGGDSAMEESNFLSKFASKVTVVHRRDEFKASKIMQDRFFANKKCSVLWNKEVYEVIGDGKRITGTKLKDTITKKMTEIKTEGIFLAIGHVPNTTMFKDILEMDEQGYLKVDSRLMTKVKGVFAAGDVQDRRYRQAITAAGTGCAAAMEVEKYLAEKE